MQIQVLRDIGIKGEHCATGSVIEVEANLARYLIGAGAAVAAVDPAIDEATAAVDPAIDEATAAIDGAALIAETATAPRRKR